MTRYRLGSAVLVTVLTLAVSARAQTSPSADDIIKALKPTTQMLHTSVTRGIRPIAPSAGADTAVSEVSTGAPAAKPAPHTGTRTAVAEAPAKTPPAAAEAPSVNLYVPFENGSAELTPAAIAALDELGKALSSPTLAGYKFRIEGHTDTVGTKPYNKSLSERRAEAVSAYLEQKYGVGTTRLEVIGLGSDHLLVPTPEQTPEPRNRRVTVVNLGA
jgi:outer membrane protein OmpA-like peptidoglycan-associated protein